MDDIVDSIFPSCPNALEKSLWSIVVTKILERFVSAIDGVRLSKSRSRIQVIDHDRIQRV